jgi:hypothetical protein
VASKHGCPAPALTSGNAACFASSAYAALYLFHPDIQTTSSKPCSPTDAFTKSTRPMALRTGAERAGACRHCTAPASGGFTSTMCSAASAVTWQRWQVSRQLQQWCVRGKACCGPHHRLGAIAISQRPSNDALIRISRPCTRLLLQPRPGILCCCHAGHGC